uniref:Uncharacterized protein n=1 Tax=Arundo donax TaxID=35708 RepID=A0A0A9CG98_ARUDO
MPSVCLACDLLTVRHLNISIHMYWRLCTSPSNRNRLKCILVFQLITLSRDIVLAVVTRSLLLRITTHRLHARFWFHIRRSQSSCPLCHSLSFLHWMSQISCQMLWLIIQEIVVRLFFSKILRICSIQLSVGRNLASSVTIQRTHWTPLILWTLSS